MRRIQSGRPENRGAYKGARTKSCTREDLRQFKGQNTRGSDRSCAAHRKVSGAAYRRESSENIYRELTREGQRFCAVAGLLEEIVVLAAFGIRVSMSPLPVLAFLWVLFVILTAAALIGASCLLDRFAGLRPAPQRAAERRCVGAVPDSYRVAVGRHGRATGRIAA